MGELTEATYWAVLGTVSGTSIGLAIDVALLAVALGPVRRHRPDVSGLFVGAAIVSLLTLLSRPLVHAVVPLFVAHDGEAADVLRMNALLGLAFAVLHAGTSALLIAGIARLATPRRHDPREPS